MTNTVTALPTAESRRQDALIDLLEDLLLRAHTGDLRDLVGLSVETAGMRLCGADDMDSPDVLMRYAGILSTGARWSSGLATGEMVADDD